MKYSIDTSAILDDAWVRGFPPDVVPGFWARFEELIDNGQLIATEEVLYELEKKEDNVYKWAKNHKNMFASTDEKRFFHKKSSKNCPSGGAGNIFS